VSLAQEIYHVLVLDLHTWTGTMAIIAGVAAYSLFRIIQILSKGKTSLDKIEKIELSQEKEIQEDNPDPFDEFVDHAKKSITEALKKEGKEGLLQDYYNLHSGVNKNFDSIALSFVFSGSGIFIPRMYKEELVNRITRELVRENEDHGIGTVTYLL
jgi:uncharacterized protein YllA (UPF0747 family)